MSKSSGPVKPGENINTGKPYGKYGTFAILMVIFLVAVIFVDGFATADNLTNVMRQIAVVTILSLGATFVITLGHTNVSYPVFHTETDSFNAFFAGCFSASGHIDFTPVPATCARFFMAIILLYPVAQLFIRANAVLLLYIP